MIGETHLLSEAALTARANAKDAIDKLTGLALQIPGRKRPVLHAIRKSKRIVRASSCGGNAAKNIHIKTKWLVRGEVHDIFWRLILPFL
jgi:hypothetical protein